MNTNRERAWFALFVVVLFCAGAAAGIVTDRVLMRPPEPPDGGGPGPRAGGPGPRGGGRGPLPLGPRESVDRLVSQLQLSPEQRTTFDTLLADRRTRLEQFYQGVQTGFETEQREIRAEIRAMLTPEQQERFDEWLRRQPPPPPGLFGRPARRGGPPGPGGP